MKFLSQLVKIKSVSFLIIQTRARVAKFIHLITRVKANCANKKRSKCEKSIDVELRFSSGAVAREPSNHRRMCEKNDED